MISGKPEKQKAQILGESELLFLEEFNVAEEEGFEPPEPCGSTVFKTAALDRSATPLCYLNYFLIF